LRKDLVIITFKYASVIKTIKIKFRIFHTMFAASAGVHILHCSNIAHHVSFMGANMIVINKPSKNKIVISVIMFAYLIILNLFFSSINKLMAMKSVGPLEQHSIFYKMDSRFVYCNLSVYVNSHLILFIKEFLVQCCFAFCAFVTPVSHTLI
jgi:hypothetical protein